jgi:hypothetical protein
MEDKKNYEEPTLEKRETIEDITEGMPVSGAPEPS